MLHPQPRDNASAKLIKGLTYLKDNDNDYCVKLIYNKQNEQEAVMEIMDCTEEIKNGGGIIACWRSFNVELPFLVPGKAPHTDADNYPEFVRWDTIDEMKTEGLCTLINGEDGWTLTKICIASDYTNNHGPCIWSKNRKRKINGSKS